MSVISFDISDSIKGSFNFNLKSIFSYKVRYNVGDITIFDSKITNFF